MKFSKLQTLFLTTELNTEGILLGWNWTRSHGEKQLPSKRPFFLYRNYLTLILPHEKRVRPEGGGGATGTVCSGPQPKEGPQAPSAGGTLGISSREAPFGSLSVLINLFPLCFKWKSNNWIRLSNFIESTLFIYSLNTEPGQDTHIFTRIVIFRLSGKEPDESAIVKCNIDQNKIL